MSWMAVLFPMMNIGAEAAKSLLNISAKRCNQVVLARFKPAIYRRILGLNRPRSSSLHLWAKMFNWTASAQRSSSEMKLSLNSSLSNTFQTINRIYMNLLTP